MSFGITTVTTWNKLLDNIPNVPSVNAFKNSLNKYLEDQEILYDYKASLRTSARKESKLSIQSTKESQQSTDVQARGSATAVTVSRSEVYVGVRESNDNIITLHRGPSPARKHLRNK